MPDPERLVQTSIRMLKRLGLTDESAWKVVFTCIVTLAQVEQQDDEWSIQWIMRAFDAVMSRARCLHPDNYDAKDKENADGRSSSPGGHDSTA